MKPIAIFRHAASEGAGYLADFLDEQHIPWQLVRIDAGEVVPADVQHFSGLVFMGGPMSVNDDLPWIPPVLALIRAAVAQDIPVLGHCLGGQLLAKALGGTVSRNAVKEIGWGEVSVVDATLGALWLGSAVAGFNAFHWHGETFSLPVGATQMLRSAYCEHQAFTIGKHLALQCHIEMTEQMIQDWCALGARELVESRTSPAVQSASLMQAQITCQLPLLHTVARRVYSQWILGLAR